MIIYRVSDYGRLGADGKPRELHIDKALDVTKCEMPKIPYGNIGELKTDGKNTVRELTECDKFTAKLIKLNEPMGICSPNSFVSLIILEGNVSIVWDTKEINVVKGDSIFIPAGLKVSLAGQAEILYSHV